MKFMITKAFIPILLILVSQIAFASEQYSDDHLNEPIGDEIYHYIPLEIWNLIYAYLFQRDLSNIFLVSHHSRGLVSSLMAGFAVKDSEKNIAYIRQFVNLKRIGFSDYNFTEENIRYLVDLTNLRELHLGDSKINDFIEYLSGLTKLESLQLNITQSLKPSPTIDTDSYLKGLSTLTDLVSLDLAKSKITGDGVIYLSGLTKLESINLEGCRLLRGYAIPNLSCFSKLKKLDLPREGRLEITGKEIRYLSRLTDLESLGLSPIEDEDLFDDSFWRLFEEGLIKSLPHLKELRIPSFEYFMWKCLQSKVKKYPNVKAEEPIVVRWFTCCWL